MIGPTAAQLKVLDLVRAQMQAGGPVPTLREIASKLGFRAHRAAACHLEALKKKGLVDWEPGKARSLRVISAHHQVRHFVEVPIFGSIPAGRPEAREEDAEGFIPVGVERNGFKPTRTTFALRVSGDSMIGRHILPGDIVVLDHGPEPRDGEIVAAMIDGATTLKTFLRRNGKPYLKAENPKYPNLIPAEELVIQGVFRALIRSLTFQPESSCLANKHSHPRT